MDAGHDKTITRAERLITHGQTYSRVERGKEAETEGPFDKQSTRRDRKARKSTQRMHLKENYFLALKYSRYTHKSSAS